MIHLKKNGCEIKVLPESKRHSRVEVLLEQRQYMNDSIQSKRIPNLNLPRFFTTYTAREERGNFKIGIIFD